MRKEYLPYYVSRAALSLLVVLLVIGFTMDAFIWFIILFSGFVLYLHSGWFTIDLTRPLFPLRRDDRGKEIQRKSFIVAMTFGVIMILLSKYVWPDNAIGSFALPVMVFVYFSIQFVLFSKVR